MTGSYPFFRIRKAYNNYYILVPHTNLTVVVNEGWDEELDLHPS